jgi:hypothetical protein
MFANTNQEYPILLFKSTGIKNLTQLAAIAGKSDKSICRSLLSLDSIFPMLAQISKKMFLNKRELFLLIDDSLIKKIYSRFLQGAGRHFDQKIGRRVISFKIQLACISDGKNIIPISFSYLFPADNPHEFAPSKLELFKATVLQAQDQFSDFKIKVLADGLFSTTEILKWCSENNIATEMRMHSNRSIEYKDQILTLKKLATLQPKGRYKARTILINWHKLSLYVTAELRQDKHGEKSIVYLVSTFKAKPAKHVLTYKIRWFIEKTFRTVKQHLGLQHCASRSLQVQFQHVSAVLLAFAFAQVAQKLYKFETPEDSIRWLKSLSIDETNAWIASLDQIIQI